MGGEIYLVSVVNIFLHQSFFKDMQTNSSICICAYFTLLCLKVTRLRENYHVLLEERERERERDGERETEEGEHFMQQLLLSQRAVLYFPSFKS